MNKASILCFSPPGRETALRLKEYFKTAYPDWTVQVFAKGRFALESDASGRETSDDCLPVSAENRDAIPVTELLADSGGVDSGNQILTDDRSVIPVTEPLTDWGREHFLQEDCLIFVGSSGIAVRTIGPLAVSKKTDPAVLVVDDQLQYVIPILSGHLGGANEIANRLASLAGAVAVLTTATDVHQKLAPDVFAQENGLKIMDFTAAKLVAAALVRGEMITVYTNDQVKDRVPDEVRLKRLNDFADYSGGGAIIISARKPNLTGKPEVLWLVPQTVYLGIGLKAGKSEEAVAQAVDVCLEQAGIEKAALAGVASIDIKSQEAGLLAFAERMHLPLQFYTAEELNQVEGKFTESAFVKQITGTDNVCERSAMLAAMTAGALMGTAGSGMLLQLKTALDGVTAALAMKKGMIRFE